MEPKFLFNKIFLIGFYLILFLPFFTLAPLLHPPDFSKSIGFRIIFSILLFFFALRLLYNKDFASKIKGEIIILKKFSSFWLLLIFFAIVLLSTLFSAEPSFSFWGTPHRGDGSLTLLFIILFNLMLLFLAENERWSKFWIFSIVIGLLVSLVGIFQHFQWFSNIFLPATTKIPSTMGTPLLLAFYLLLLIFPTLSFGLKEKKFWKKFFYFGAILIFIFVIILAGSQAAYLGFGTGLLFFLLFYPKKIKFLKISLLVLISLAVLSIHFIKNNPNLPFSENFIFQSIVSWKMDKSRLSAWKVSTKALFDRPLLGYGPGNFSIPFDKYYDPSLPDINRQPGKVSNHWWDRAHNLFFEIALTLGIPGLIVYLLILATVFWQLEKIKKKRKEDFALSLTALGIQAGFVSYLVDSFFAFDSVSTLLILFFLIAWGIFLAKKDIPSFVKEKGNIFLSLPGFYKIILIFLLSGFLVFFIWNYNLKPLLINKEINWADWYSKNNNCQKAVEKMEKIVKTNSILDGYLEHKYIDFIGACLKQYPNQKIVFSQKAIELLREAIKKRPTYTRSWLFLGNYINIWLENDKNISQNKKDELIKEAERAFAKAAQLSPKRQEIYVGWAKTKILQEKYQEALEKAEICLLLDQTLSSCWWLKGSVYFYLKDNEKAIKTLEEAFNRNYDIIDKEHLEILLNYYLKAPQKDKLYYQKLSKIYEKLLALDNSNIQYHASLAFVYKELGNYEGGIREALMVLYLSPASRANVEEFLQKEIGYFPQDPQAHFSKAKEYKKQNNFQKARLESLVALYLSENMRQQVEEFWKSI